MQLTYTAYHSKSVIGSIQYSTINKISSFAAEEDIEFGVVVKRGTNKEKQVLNWADAITVAVLGVSIRSDKTAGKYVATDLVPVLTNGVITVNTDADVIAGQKAYVIHDTGAFTNVATDNLGIGKFVTSGTGLVEVEINL